MPLKSTRHHKTGTESEKDEEDPIMMMRSQKWQQRTMAKAKRESVASSSLYPTVMFLPVGERQRQVANKRGKETGTQ
jgi:hypothetical protein